VYHVTGAGGEELNRSAQSLANVREALRLFLDRAGDIRETHR
jgi:hypothetical protein